jgi:hypothetical protein
MFIYLDESGDLGFDFENNNNPSRFFVITLLITKNRKNAKQIGKAVYRTLDNKLNANKHKSRLIKELKGSATTLEIKNYFLKHMNNINEWSLYTIVLDKKLLLTQLKNDVQIDRVYNQMTHQLLECVELSGVKYVNLVVDRSKNPLGVKEFNDFLYANLTLALNLEAKLYITHDKSESNYGIQAVDMFCYGIARKYEHNDKTWYSLFKNRIVIECKF